MGPKWVISRVWTSQIHGSEVWGPLKSTQKGSKMGHFGTPPRALAEGPRILWDPGSSMLQDCPLTALWPVTDGIRELGPPQDPSKGVQKGSRNGSQMGSRLGAETPETWVSIYTFARARDRE